MRLYIDTADSGAIAEFLSTGLFSGVTTNPVILRAAGLGPEMAGEFYARCREAGAEEIFLQSFGRTAEEIVAQGLKYRSFGPEVVVKVVGSRTGAVAVAALRSQGVPALMTAVHSARQAITAMAAKATYVTPYLSEMDRAGKDGYAEMLAVHRILTAANTPTKLVLAGVHDTHTVVRCAQEGVGFATLPPDIAGPFIEESLSDEMEAMFNLASGV